MGGKSSLDIIRVGRRAARMVQSINEFKDVKFKEFHIHNMAASAALGYSVRLQALSESSVHEDYTEVSFGVVFQSARWCRVVMHVPNATICLSLYPHV